MDDINDRAWSSGNSTQSRARCRYRQDGAQRSISLVAFRQRLHRSRLDGKLLVAIANKHTRQIWAMLAHDVDYDPHACLTHPMHRQLAAA